MFAGYPRNNVLKHSQRTDNRAVDTSEQECKYDKGWNGAIKKVEELICSYSPADMWIPTEVKLPPEPNKEENPGDWKEYAVTIDGAVLPTSLTYLGDSEWGSV